MTYINVWTTFFSSLRLSSSLCLAFYLINIYAVLMKLNYELIFFSLEEENSANSWQVYKHFTQYEFT